MRHVHLDFFSQQLSMSLAHKGLLGRVCGRGLAMSLQSLKPKAHQVNCWLPVTLQLPLRIVKWLQKGDQKTQQVQSNVLNARSPTVDLQFLFAALCRCPARTLVLGTLC